MAGKAPPRGPQPFPPQFPLKVWGLYTTGRVNVRQPEKAKSSSIPLLTGVSTPLVAPCLPFPQVCFQTGD